MTDYVPFHDMIRNAFIADRPPVHPPIVRVVWFRQADYPPKDFFVPLPEDGMLKFGLNYEFKSETKYPCVPLEIYDPATFGFIAIMSGGGLEITSHEYPWLIIRTAGLSSAQCSGLQEEVRT
ncbi:hypothetical protein NP233_g9935 [Leucocoprinus birnbaumii]|uniref:Uncharacterized protein n=1 Tax=Leucocoprinus birnbaumii TaxID=56174 RepID=A0AAD5VJA3_9AGAR|nr:hypothetical protein NP233_g9935 [Leucocoprinus birnbaumii]